MCVNIRPYKYYTSPRLINNAIYTRALNTNTLFLVLLFLHQHAASRWVGTCAMAVMQLKVPRTKLHFGSPRVRAHGIAVRVAGCMSEYRQGGLGNEPNQDQQ